LRINWLIVGILSPSSRSPWFGRDAEPFEKRLLADARRETKGAGKPISRVFGAAAAEDHGVAAVLPV
jgi:hypothetical protein